MNVRFLIIDALNLIRRVYAAQPGDDGTERVEAARFATVQSLQRALRECAPTHVVSVFDSQEPGWRHRLYPAYKAGRTPMPEALAINLGDFKKSFSEMGISSVQFPALEADDIIATLATKAASRKGAVTILSTDKVFFQLLSPQITIRDHFQKRDLNRTSVVEKFGVEPVQFVDFLALTGDSTNNITGVPSVGPKTAARLIAQFGSLNDVLATAYVIPGKAGEAIRAHGEDARLAQLLVRLKVDLDLGLNLASFRYST